MMRAHQYLQYFPGVPTSVSVGTLTPTIRGGADGDSWVLLRPSTSSAAFAEPKEAQEKSLAKTAQAAVSGREVSSLMSAALTPETIPAGDGRATATMIRSSMARSSSGFAITPKPSANLYILLQVISPCCAPRPPITRTCMRAHNERLQTTSFCPLLRL